MPVKAELLGGESRPRQRASDSLSAGSGDVEKADELSSRIETRGKIETSQWVCITSFQLVYSFVNTGFGLFVLPIEAVRLNEESASLWVGFYLALCGLTQLVCPLAGKFSDRYQSVWGKRRPCISMGCLMGLIFFAVMWLASHRIMPHLYVFGLFGCQLALNIIYSSQCGIPADIQQEHDDCGVPNDGAKGIVSGLIAVHAFAGSLVAMAAVVWAKDVPVTVVYPVYMVSLAVTCVVVVAATREAPTDAVTHPPLTWRDIRRSYVIDLQEDMEFFWVCAGRMCYYISTSVAVFLYYYLRDMLNVQDEATRREMLGMLAIGTQLVGAATAIPCSRLSNSVGRKPVIYGSCVAMLVAFLLYIASPQVHHGHSWPLTLGAGVVYGLGSGAYLSVDYALALDCMPVGKTAAEAFGLWGVAGFLGSTIGPLVGGSLLAFCADPHGVLAGRPHGEDRYNLQGYVSMMIVDGCLMTILVALATYQIKKVK